MVLRCRCYVASLTETYRSSWIGEPVRRGWNWTVDSYGVQARANGVTSARGGHSTTTYIGTDDLGRQHHKMVVTSHGRVPKAIGH